LEEMERTELTASEDHPARRVKRRNGTSRRLHNHVRNAQESLDPTAHPAKQASRELKEFPAAKETMASQVLAANKESQDHLDLPDQAANPARRDPTATMRKKARRERQESPAIKEHPVHQALLVTKEDKENQEDQAQLDHLDHLVKAENPVTRDSQENPAHQDHPVKMPTIALVRNARRRLRQRPSQRQSRVKRQLDIWRWTIRFFNLQICFILFVQSEDASFLQK
jgi:hypothetical protein